MDIYKFKQLDNGDILLSKMEIDTSQYTIEEKDNGDKILRKITMINITLLKNIKYYDFSNSKI